MHAIGEMNHAEFDARFVLLEQHYCNWTRSELPVDTPNFTLGQLHLFIQRRLTDALRSWPEMKKQAFNDERLSMRYLAYEVLQKSSCTVHLRQLQSDECTNMIHKDLSNVIAAKQMITANDVSPLWGKDGGYIQETPERKFWKKDLDAGQHRWDLQLIESIVGKRGREADAQKKLSDLLHESVPYLMTLDTTHIKTAGTAVRKKLHELLRDKIDLYPSLRTTILDTVFEEWLQTKDADEELIAKIEREYAQTDLRKECMNNLRSVPEKELDRMLMEHNRMPRGTLKEKKDALTDCLLAKINPAPDVSVMNNDSPAVMKAYFGQLRTKEILTEEDKNLLRRRLPVIEWQMMTLLTRVRDIRRQKYDIGENSTHPLFGEYEVVIRNLMEWQLLLEWANRHVSIKWSDNPAFGYTQIATAAHADNINLKKMRGML